jgi:hypothetical protein
LGKRSPGVLGELVKRLLFKGCRHGLDFLIISGASSGGNATLSAGRYARLLMCPWHRQVVRYPRLQ